MNGHDKCATLEEQQYNIDDYLTDYLYKNKTYKTQKMIPENKVIQLIKDCIAVGQGIIPDSVKNNFGSVFSERHDNGNNNTRK